MGGRGGADPGDWLAPGGRPTRGTFEVDETKVGSEICFLFTGRLRREPDPGPRWGIVEALLAAEAREVDEASGATSFRGGVALAT